VWSPLARGRLACRWDEATGTEPSAEDGFADMLYTPGTERSDRVFADAVGIIAGQRGVSRAQIALAWLHTNPVVVARLVGASKTSHIDDAISSLGIELTGEEIARLEHPYTTAPTCSAYPTTPSSSASCEHYRTSPPPTPPCTIQTADLGRQR
jgi:aryl-alcohol dehydrogenase-like predicted oxidoreductase